MAKTANITKPKKAEAVTETIEPVSSVDNTASENEALKAQIAEMKAQMELMAKMMTTKGDSEQAVSAPKNDRMITFVNLTNGTAILRGNQNWALEGQYASRAFLEREARIIVNNMPNMIRSGMVYITDAQFVKDNDLADAYLNMLSDKEMKELLAKDANYVIDVYKNVSDGQKQIIVDMIIGQRKAGVKIDNNILVELGELCGKDLVHIDE
nr:MAG TPA: hypothetical protein [Herelleviridae sp.]